MIIYHVHVMCDLYYNGHSMFYVHLVIVVELALVGGVACTYVVLLLNTYAVHLHIYSSVHVSSPVSLQLSSLPHFPYVNWYSSCSPSLQQSEPFTYTGAYPLLYTAYS